MGSALVIGSSGGIGQALVTALKAQGHSVQSLSRSDDGLDITDEGSIAKLVGRLDGPFDMVFIATGALEIGPYGPEKTLRSLDPTALIAQFTVNAMGPILVLKHLMSHIPKSKPAHIAVLSARVGSIGDNGLGGWYSYRASKAALNQLIHTAAIEVTRSHPQTTLALLHPGTVATDFTAKYVGKHPTVPPAAAAANLISVLLSLTPEQSGRFYDWAGETVVW